MKKERIIELTSIVQTQLEEQIKWHQSLVERKMPILVLEKHEQDINNWKEVLEVLNLYVQAIDLEIILDDDRPVSEPKQEGCCMPDPNWKAPDMVNQPHHYTTGQYEVIDVIKDWLTEEEFRGYIKGNLIKYISRERYKNGDEDMKKAEFYLHYLNSDGEKGIK